MEPPTQILEVQVHSLGAYSVSWWHYPPQKDNAPCYTAKTVALRNMKKSSRPPQFPQFSTQLTTSGMCRNKSNPWIRLESDSLRHRNRTSVGVLWCLVPGCWRSIFWVLWVARWGLHGLNLLWHIPRYSVELGSAAVGYQVCVLGSFSCSSGAALQGLVS